MFDRVPDMAMRRADIAPDALAFHDHASGRDWSFAEVNAAADGIARGLTECGLTEGDRLAILCLNRVEFFLTLFACQKTGVLLCPLNWRQPAPELIDTLAPLTPKAILYDAGHADTAAEVARAVGGAALAIETVVAGWITQGGPPLHDAVPATRPWYLLFSSGTTGRPKAVIQTARMAWANAVNIGQATGMTGADRSVNFLPLFHTAGINLYTLPLFLNGGTSTILPKFEPATLLDLIRKGAVTQFFGVPAIYQAFSILDGIDATDWSGVRCGCGGAPLAEPLIRFFAVRGVDVLNGMGMTETGPTVFLMDPAHASAKIGSVGKAQVLTEVRLAGVAAGTPGEGELHMRGPNITPGYYDNPEETAAAFTKDGWLVTGDVARRDADGYYYIIDRIKDMYISGGENVYPAEVERVLCSHPAILEVAVIGVPDEKWGECGAAFVLLRPGETLDAAALMAWCRERLAAYKVPAHVRLVEEFPRTAAGKIRKPDLKAMFDD
ncbi:AMP-binding protein [Thalassorhabdomicrobium marinisediminis]|uniref:3-methylmercaptopropionyl-CoA ligase n=1 Tax=Thalassorhabdomicrobium marinisediminis TaxID=2170577 RepID=A0A2T7FX75_9RHOB|nr:AMP-binding protein [Thalassorhabdomicrobium marinisediminis]PVA06766.1 acid--CoA ligase [Thalassorhabdomicrobium marinisediminis]